MRKSQRKGKKHRTKKAKYRKFGGVKGQKKTVSWTTTTQDNKGKSLQPSKTRKARTKAELDSEIRKSRASASILRARRIAHTQHVMVNKDMPVKSSLLYQFVFDQLRRNPTFDFKKIDIEKLRRVYNNWVQKRRSGSPSSHDFDDAIIHSSAEFESLIKNYNIYKLNELILKQ